jgi:hypothetical protein
MTGATVPPPGRSLASERRTRNPRGRYPPRRRAGLTVSGTSDRPFGQPTGPRLKRASGPLQWSQLFRLNRSAGAGVEPATRCLTGICSTHLSYPRGAIDRTRTDASGFPRRSTLELRPRPSFSGTRPRIAHRASRDLTSPGMQPSEGGGVLIEFYSKFKNKISLEVGCMCTRKNLCHPEHSGQADARSREDAGKRPPVPYPFTHTTWRNVWTISTRSACAAMTASMSL